MRYQERIYIQNDNRGVRNKDILNVNMSSDICIFKSPTFDLSGATKIQCDSVECDPSDISLDAIFSAVTATCYTTATTITTCFSATTWETKFYADSVLVSTNNFYTTSVFNDNPTQAQLLSSIILNLRDLGYSYSRSGTTFTIDKPYGVKELELDLCVSIYIKPFYCPAGYSATPANDVCKKIEYTAVTYTGAGATIASGDTNANYAQYGAFFYGNIQSGYTLPVSYTGDSTSLQDQNATQIPLTAIVLTGNTFWSNSSSGTTDGRLNQIGLAAAPSYEWVGFSKCVDIETAGTYYIGVAGDNDAMVKLNGIEYIKLSGAVADNFKKWSVFEFYLDSGLNIIEMEGMNEGSFSSFGAEIYKPASFAALTAATTTGQTGLIFTTKGLVGDKWQLGESFAYSCPSGYALNTCSPTYTCDKITTTGISSCLILDCLDNCVVVCDNTFSYIDNSSTGVYTLGLTESSIPFTFNFTGNTDTFLTSNVLFKYEVYRYLPNSNVFKLPPVYKSEQYPYSSFSGTNQISVSIPTDSLGLDGDYIVKGFFETEACTDFLMRLGKKIDTSSYKTGEIYGTYVPELDYYFVAIREAETPVFNGTGSDEPTYSPVSLYQQVILVDFSQEGNIPADSDELELYERTGSTFVLTNEYVGDVLVTLNGLTLSKDVDFTLSGRVLTFIGPISNGDTITLFYTRTTSTKLISNTILIDAAIPSGTTNTQGTSKYFYNTTTGKYEAYATNEPLSYTKIIVILNGVTLSDEIDYYQSTSNPNRIILNGSLMVGDIINIIFCPKAIVIDGIVQSNNYIGWSIENGPKLLNGEFSLQLSSDANFSGFTVSSVVPYQINVTSYGGVLTITGDVETKLYYRVKNTKNYESICGDPIESIAYSETVPIVIQSNAINSY